MLRAADWRDHPHPRYVVWELTLKCDLACKHCGSRAGKARENELSLEEGREVIAQLAAAGTVEITFIGGEAYLHRDWLELVRTAREAGIRPTMTTGGRGVSQRVAEAAAEAGMESISVSIDGLEGAHDELRNLRGAYKQAFQALEHVAAAGINPLANTQINRRNLADLEELAERFVQVGVRGWQVQLTGPMGRAADQPDYLLQPYQMLDLMPRLAAIADRCRSSGMLVEAANNLGYFGAFESKLRRAHWKGCNAGKFTLGIEANGDVKGCPSLPSSSYVGGNLRDQPLSEIWEESPQIRFSRDRTLEELWGHCKGCYYADICKGGCAWTSHTLLGKRGNMPYCHHRATELAKRGIRERIEFAEAAPGLPFDHGRYELIEEPMP